MYVPSPIPWTDGETLGEHLESRGISRRQFLQFCSSLAAIYGLEQSHGSPDRPGAAVHPAPERGLDPAPGVHRVRRDRAAHGGAYDRRPGARPGVARLPHTLMAAAGSAAEKALQDSACATNAGKYLLVVTGSVPLAARRDLHHDRRPHRQGRFWRRRQGRGGQSSRSAPAPTGAASRRRAPIPPARWASRDVIKDKPVVNIAGCPPDRRRGHRHDRALPHLRPAARRWTPKAGRCSPTEPGSTTSVPGAPTSTPGSSSRRSTTRRRARAGVSTRWAARARRPSRPARSSSGTPAPAGRSARATPASAAPSRTSGTR